MELPSLLLNQIMSQTVQVAFFIARIVCTLAVENPVWHELRYLRGICLKQIEWSQNVFTKSFSPKKKKIQKFEEILIIYLLCFSIVIIIFEKWRPQILSYANIIKGKI